MPNPSFEDTVYCPVTLADLSATTFWNAPTLGSPDYFNSCTSNPNIDVPSNGFGNQAAHFGDAYVGISVYDTQNTYSYREYIQVQLKQQLVNGQKYFVSFYVSLSDLNDYGIKELGAYFSPNQVFYNSMDSTLSFLPQVEFSDNVIIDKTNWIKISGSFIASGTENFLLVGNFNRKQTTTATQVGTNNINYAYYYVDDVCVSDDSSTCAIPIGIVEHTDNVPFVIYPNPSKDFINIKVNSNDVFNVSIYNSTGQLIYIEQNINISDLKIDISQFNSNLIFVKLNINNNEFTYKLLKQ